MNWAMGARTDGVSAQCVLFVVADTANEHGVSIHADPDYIAARTRQSRATVFRRLKELEAAGALTRLKRFRDDGAPVYEIRLRLEVSIDYDNVSDDDDDPQYIEGESQFETQGESQIETGKVSPVRQAESQSCDSKSPSKNPEEPPNPPSGGGLAVVDQDLENDLTEFSKGYPAPITNLPRLRIVLSAMTPLERKRVLTAVKGYAEFIADCERKRKPRAVKDADRWVASGMWQGYAVAGERVEGALQAVFIEADSGAGKALITLHKIGGMSSPLLSAGRFYLPRALSAQALALANAPPESEWEFIAAENVHQVRAWNDLLAREMAGKARPEIVHSRNRGGVRGFMAPWPWPPRKDGSLCTGPPAKESG